MRQPGWASLPGLTLHRAAGRFFFCRRAPTALSVPGDALEALFSPLCWCFSVPDPRPGASDRFGSVCWCNLEVS